MVALQIFVMVLSFAAAATGVILIFTGVRGVPELSSPRCGKCHYDLRGLRFDGDERACPECGADLKQPKAVRWGEQRWQPWMIVAGLAALCSPILFFVLLIQVQMIARPPRVPTALPTQSNATLLANLPKSMNEPVLWNELDVRLKSGRLTPAETDQAFAAITTHLRDPNVAGKPRDRIIWSSAFVDSALASGNLKPERMQAFCQAFLGDGPEVKVPALVRMASAPREGGPVGTQTEFEIACPQFNGGSGFIVIWAVRGQKLDGKPAALLRDVSVPSAKFEANGDYLSGSPRNYSRWRLAPPAEAGPGEHELEATFDVAVVPAAARLMGIDGRAGTPDKWPKAICMWSSVAKRKFKLIGPDEEIVNLVTDPARDPVAAGGLALKGIATRAASQGVTLMFDWAMPSKAPGMPLMGEIRVRGEGIDQTLGIWSWISNGTVQAEWKVRVLPPELKTIDVTITPAPRSAELRNGVTEIWGKPIEFKDVPLERHDLPEAKGP
ncbi:MAG: hypothetical protein NTW19_20975 [Planctomycetota bacterium]|nr:hypothetical protein [Planctomycetota bacterium]